MLLYICCFLDNEISSEYSDKKGDFFELTKNILEANRSVIIKSDTTTSNFVSIPYDLSNYYISFYHKDNITLTAIRNSLLEYDDNIDLNTNSIYTINSNSSINSNKFIKKSKNEDDQRILLFLESLSNNISIVYNENNIANPKLTKRNNMTNRILEILQNYFQDFNDAYKTLGVDKISLVQRELELIKIEKLEILNQLIDRELDLESLLDKSESLKSNSLNFKIKCKKTNNQTKNNKSCLRIFCIIWILIGLIIILLNYGQFVDGTKNFLNSFSKNNNSKNDYDGKNISPDHFEKAVNSDFNSKLIRPVKSKSNLKINSININ